MSAQGLQGGGCKPTILEHLWATQEKRHFMDLLL